jgi:hypothetical protein
MSQRREGSIRQGENSQSVSFASRSITSRAMTSEAVVNNILMTPRASKEAERVATKETVGCGIDR